MKYLTPDARDYHSTMAGNFGPGEFHLFYFALDIAHFSARRVIVVDLSG
jgi:hypothetical protein